jgi:hypothetical protein
LELFQVKLLNDVRLDSSGLMSTRLKVYADANSHSLGQVFEYLG